MARALVHGLASALALAGCVAHPAGSVRPPTGDTDAPPMSINARNAHAFLGRAVVLKGIARDAKLGPAIETGALAIYCLGVEHWPAALSGHLVIARGTLEQTKALESRVGPNGEVSAGTDGPVWILRGCEYDPVP